jgi:hypothetical protein
MFPINISLLWSFEKGMTVAQRPIELPNDAVSDTTEVDNSNEDGYLIIQPDSKTLYILKVTTI